MIADFQSIRDYPHRLEEVVSANKNKVGAPFQYAGTPFAALAMVKSMTGLRHLQEMEDTNNYQTQLHGSSDPSIQIQALKEHAY